MQIYAFRKNRYETREGNALPKTLPTLNNPLYPHYKPVV